MRCFSSPRLLPGFRDDRSGLPGCPIRRSADRGIFAPPRSFSQLITSFFASESLGILHTPLFTFFPVVRTTFLSYVRYGIYWLFYFCLLFTRFQHVNDLLLLRGE